MGAVAISHQIAATPSAPTAGKRPMVSIGFVALRKQHSNQVEATSAKATPATPPEGVLARGKEGPVLSRMTATSSIYSAAPTDSSPASPLLPPGRFRPPFSKAISSETVNTTILTMPDSHSYHFHNPASAGLTASSGFSEPQQRVSALGQPSMPLVRQSASFFFDFPNEPQPEMRQTPPPLLRADSGDAVGQVVDMYYYRQRRRSQ
jgi:hypothetical protein